LIIGANTKGKHMQTILEKQVTEAEAKVADWQEKVKALQQQIAESTQVVAVATREREQHALTASLGNHAAIAAIKTARSNQHEAEQRLADLVVALPAAQAQLAEAERGATGARRAIAKVMAEKLMKKRVEVSGQIDSVIADLLTPLLDEYEKLGGEIVNMPDVVSRSIFGVASNEAALSLRRLRAALPKIFDRIFPNAQYDEMKKAPLEKSEAEYWNLPPADEVKAA
jgi:hypothetical protein